MFKNLNKEIVRKTTFKQELTKNIILCIFWTIILYFCLTEFNESFVTLFNSVKDGNNAFDLILIILPIMIITTIMITLGNFIIYDNKKK